MKPRIYSLVILLTMIGVIPGVALDRMEMNAVLYDLSKGVSQTAYSMSEREGSAERATFEAASAKTEKAKAELAKLISKIETPKDLETALDAIKEFEKKDALHSYTANIALGMLKDRASFLNLPYSGAQEGISEAVEKVDASRAPSTSARLEQLLTRSQRGLVMVQLPIAESVIGVEDNKKNRRIESLKEMLKRHECKILSSAIDDSGDQPQTNIYISGKKFVLEALMRNYKGSEIKSNFKAVMILSTGGFLGKASIEVVVSPDSSAPEKGSLQWYQAVLEKDPWKYMAETNYAKLSQLGKIEVVAGERKLRLKNAKLDIWIFGPNGTKRDAIYKNAVEFGDVYVAAR